MESYENLLRPIKLGNVTVRNRVVFQPHFTSLGVEEGLPTERHAYYYAERAAGGVGLIITEVQAVHKTGKMSPKYIEAFDRKVLDGYRLIADMVHEKGGRIFSCSDAIARVIERRLAKAKEKKLFEKEALRSAGSGIQEQGKQDLSSRTQDGTARLATEKKKGNIVGVCPDCGGALWHIEGCMVCKACGYSKCG